LHAKDKEQHMRDIPSQIHGTAQCLGVVNGLKEKFPVKRLKVRTSFKAIYKLNNIKKKYTQAEKFIVLSQETSLLRGDQLTCINCLALSLDLASSENNVTSFIAHNSPRSLADCKGKIRHVVLNFTNIWKLRNSLKCHSIKTVNQSCRFS
jgi:hypothetical protein